MSNLNRVCVTREGPSSPLFGRHEFAESVQACKPIGLGGHSEVVLHVGVNRMPGIFRRGTHQAPNFTDFSGIADPREHCLYLGCVRIHADRSSRIAGRACVGAMVVDKLAWTARVVAKAAVVDVVCTNRHRSWKAFGLISRPKGRIKAGQLLMQAPSDMARASVGCRRAVRTAWIRSGVYLFLC